MPGKTFLVLLLLSVAHSPVRDLSFSTILRGGAPPLYWAIGPSLRKKKYCGHYRIKSKGSQNDAITKQWSKWDFFALWWSVPCFRKRFFAKRRFLKSWLVVSKWPPGKQNGSLLFSGMDSSQDRQRKWLPCGGSSLDGEFWPLWNALKGFQCVSMVFFSHYDVFA